MTEANRILLVDDNPTNLQVLYGALEHEGYDLLIAQSGADAIEIAKTASPSLILLDINMPEMDGFETCKRLKADPTTADSVVLFLSARNEAKDKVQGLELGAVDYISKPFEFEEVLARVRTHLSTYHQQDALKRRNQELEDQIAGGFVEVTPDSLKQLVLAGESETLEFKSTLRHNLHTGKNDKAMENAVLKSIAGFLNSNGGHLLVGVDDEGVILGLGKDDLPNPDRILRHLNSLISEHLGSQVAPYVQSKVVDIDGSEVLSVQCLTTPIPIFVRRGGNEAFYVRMGPSSRQLSPSEVLAHVRSRES